MAKVAESKCSLMPTEQQVMPLLFQETNQVGYRRPCSTAVDLDVEVSYYFIKYYPTFI